MSVAQAVMKDWLTKNAGQTYGNYIAGQWKDADSGSLMARYDASDRSQVLGHFQQSGASDIAAAVAAAETAFGTWSKRPAPERAQVLLRFAELLDKEADGLAYRCSAEQGKVLAEAYGEVGRAAAEVRFAAGEALRMNGEVHPSEKPNMVNTVMHQPIGVIGAITPWNFPIVAPVRKIAPALAYGCTVVLKPASLTPWCAVYLMELLEEAGVPPGVVNLVTGSGSEAGNALVTHPQVRGISFTGSSELGKRINAQAAGQLKKTQLELGGKNAAIVLDAESIDGAAKQIVGAAFSCTGQRCTAISRVIVLKRHADAMEQALVSEMTRIQAGPAWDEKVGIGPLIDQGQLESVQHYVQLGLEEGAQLVCGGEVLTGANYDGGAYMAPALFRSVQPHMKLAMEEIFGPVLCMIEVEDEQAAVEAANATVYGLAASLFTSQHDACWRIADKLECGMVHVNHGTASQAHMPFGGVKQSGYGAYSIGHSNMAFFTEPKAVYIQYTS
ncbi:aldehyde dehydrogenase family protein [Marinicrinis sediminis]|uniref:Aldehyde dehydrogenase family protein n=1 Tax=Marinicrinis sediminis TaxID=1652465 RepID=A0ABW5RAD5_9BACL